MKNINFATLLLLLTFSLLSCKNKSQKSFAIRDFKQSLQPYLTAIVSKGIVGFDSSTRFIDANLTYEELKQLSNSEHPVLRATAFRIMLEKPNLNHFDLLMTHLDDTAIVATDAGEWGIRYYTIADDIIHNSTWKNMSEKNKTIDAVITKHNYLRSAYTILTQIPTDLKYYSYIKEMAQRNRPFDEIEYALYALAKYKKAEDVNIIKELLLSNSWGMGFESFKLMEEFPNNAYLEVYKNYFKHVFYRKICRDHDNTNATEFIKSFATYKIDSSAAVLNIILNKKPFMPCTADTNTLKYELAYAIWNNKCEAYSKLRKQIEGYVKEQEKDRFGLPMDKPEIVTPEKITW